MCMEININKRKLIIINRHLRKIKQNIKCNNEDLEVVATYKYLESITVKYTHKYKIITEKEYTMQ